MVQIQVLYTGSLRCASTHAPSAATVVTDAPVDNHGKGESFSPTDLVATGLGTCMLTVMGIRAGAHEAALHGATATVRKHMTTAGPRRIAKLEVTLQIPEGRDVPPAERERLEQAAHNCPVRLSLLDAIEVPVTFRWP